MPCIIVAACGLDDQIKKSMMHNFYLASKAMPCELRRKGCFLLTNRNFDKDACL